MDFTPLFETANAIVADGKGILAADESSPTIKKRFDGIGVESNEANRQVYRSMLFTTSGVADFVSGVILFDETIRQQSVDGRSMVEVLRNGGMIPGIKVDKGAKPLANRPNETVTEGLDGLRDRCTEYSNLGARFAKWRAVIRIGENIPSQTCIATNAHALARYAAICQETGLVPIVEPEVLMDGAHTIERCAEVTEATLAAVYQELAESRVVLEGTLLKPNMILSGKDCPTQAEVQRVAEETIRVLKSSVPAEVPGIVFLSGGQSSELATMHLNAMNTIGGVPWELSFSYGRALQEATLEAWDGNLTNTDAAQEALYHRAKCNGAARFGDYTDKMEAEASLEMGIS